MLQAFYQEEYIEAGCDEAGRGCLAGPVFAAAVILKKTFFHPLLNDSKKLNLKTRLELRTYIQQEALAYAVASISPEEIDQINILQASIKAMHEAIHKLNLKPQSLLIDGNRFNPYKKLPYHCIVKGDMKYASIAAASILAKTYRDDYMEELHKKYPQYAWNSNKGYPTLKHREAIEKFGITAHHRKSFTLLSTKQNSLF
ncbi:MAG: ribonuclease HII [Chitinophagaceae bacterium]